MEIKQYIKDGMLSVVVKPNAPKTEVVSWDNDKQALRMNVHAAPEKGKANLEIVKFFKKKFKVDVIIVRGTKRHNKMLKIVKR